ncbi:hypothetical protein SAMN05421759_11429 [Roseivivax lentus]|uniref:Major facilitator superfamily (MFS) profile domain-containing protein n=1 Tax=Roseivivax lentus TaxID=633194 RepID=A0A1N7PB18_9RHOB|nr:fused MFS/spermidine synthase [Roseivivax lentus]SIT07707.1 hypothetical protein SAMN05421759_11429 [Roseivivax lentus]
MRFGTLITLILVLSVVGLTYEIAAGRVLAPFFGTSLVTWTAVIATVLAGFSLGNALGGLVAERPPDAAAAAVRRALVATAALMALSPVVLALLYGMGARGTSGMMFTVFVAFFPASVLISFPSPFLAKLAVEARPGREGSSLGLILAAGSLGAIAGAIIAGFVALPLIGSAATFSACGAAALACVLFVRGAPPDADPSRGRTAGSTTLLSVWPAGLAILLSMANGAVCQYESGLSCIDVLRHGNTIQLQSDRTPQAAERTLRSDEAAGTPPELVLPYTQWLWARMDRDLGPAPAVLFIGGGGYTLPTRLLAERPEARAIAVEIDPLVTSVVRDTLPRAGAMIAKTGFVADSEALDDTDGGRLGIVHADGRVYINEAERRFDAAVIDAFSSGSVPAHLATLETYERLRAVVDGPVYVNLIDRPDGRLARGVHAILRGLYSHVEAVQGPLSNRGRANIVLAAAQTPLAALDRLPRGYAPTEITPARTFTDDRGWVGHR